MKKVLFYALGTCPGCRKTQKFFEDNNVEYEYLDYDAVPEDVRARMREEMGVTGTPSFPWVRIGGEVIVGYSPVRYAELLGLKLEKKPWER